MLPPPSTWFLKRVSGITKGSAMTGKETVGTVTLRALYEIALVKQAYDPGQAVVPAESIVRGLVATARSIGLKITR